MDPAGVAGGTQIAPQTLRSGDQGLERKGRGPKGQKRAAASEEGGVWLERDVSYGVTVARGQTHPWPTLPEYPVHGVLARVWAPQCVCGLSVCSLQVIHIVHTNLPFLLHVNIVKLYINLARA